MKTNMTRAVAAALALAASGGPAAAEPIDAEVVFVLDTTGSMSGLIEGAKQKIWSIAGGIIQRAGGEVRIGLVPYRDRGDEYVTRLFPLTNNLDQVYSDLQLFKAAGGGDMPESVNQALHEAVARIQWSESPRVMRTIFVVGDCPPHMDYQDDVKYQESCAIAAKKDIVVNTVQCGGQASTTPIWREMARLTNGGFSQIGQTGNMRMEKTPFDGEIQRVNLEITKTVLPYGSTAAQSSMRKLVFDNAGASSGVAASRNEVKAKAIGRCELSAPVTGKDLTESPDMLMTLGEEDMPEEFKGLSAEARQAKLDEAVKKRRELNSQLLELDRKRSAYLLESAKNASESSAPASFDEEVLKSIERQLDRLRSRDTRKSGAAGAPVSCRVEPDYAVRLADKAGEAYVKVTLAADKVVAANRPSVNLAIVLDRSGSMSGDKIVKAREAACEAIRRLDSKDIVSVVAYDNRSEVIVPAQYVMEKEAIIARINSIQPCGSTALFDGVSAGAAELKKFKGKCEISRVLLLSDGQANVGPSSAEELGRYGALLMKDGIAVSTVGLGVDYNEDLMTRLSQKSDGNSYFVDKTDDLPRVFASELGDVLSVAATKVALKVKFGVGFTPVALIGRDGRILDGVVTIDLNQLYGGQEKYVIVKCDAAPGAVGSAREIANAEVTYVDPKDEKSKTVTGVGTVTYSADAAAVSASVNKSVVRERALNENAMRTEEALRLADRGDFSAAEALIRSNYDNSVKVQGMIGPDAALESDANMQLGNSRRMNRAVFSGSVRKEMKTKSFQQMNQQSTK